jgi:hypothetical protein
MRGARFCTIDSVVLGLVPPLMVDVEGSVLGFDPIFPTPLFVLHYSRVCTSRRSVIHGMLDLGRLHYMCF